MSLRSKLKKYRMPVAKILVLNIVVFTFTAVLHELGHAVFGLSSGCENIRIIIFDLEVFSAYTSMECPEAFLTTNYDKVMMFLSSYFFILPISAVLFLLKNKVVRSLGFILLGANIMASAYDFALFYESYLVRFGLILGGILVIVHGQVDMVISVLRQRTLLTHPEAGEILDNTRNFIRGENQTNKHEEGAEDDDNSS